MITIIDYGLGNILAFVNVYNHLNIPVKIATHSDDLANATKLILPGVGSFDYAMKLLNKSGMKSTIERLVLRDKVPILGVCVGMQILANSSDEGELPGLGWIDGKVSKMDFNVRLPHMGWNNVNPMNYDSIFRDMDKEIMFYFLHSYCFICSNQYDVLASTDYGQKFSCAVRHDNIYGVQFHPEKSHHFGIQILTNFAEI